MKARAFSTLRHLQHENPLGLPRSGTPPNFPRMQRGLPQKRAIENVRKVVAVSSAKGGVGKSTIAANLALAFARLGHRSGILDTDIFGPSIPTLFNLTDADEPHLSPQNRLLPLTNYGVKTMSMGYLVKPSDPIVWRGLMVMKALQQLLHEVDWGGLDVLVLDMPPGTGDTQLTISQQVVVDGALLVSTPQTLSLSDTLKGLALFQKVNIPILGMIQNMAHFTCPHCNTATPVFAPPKQQSQYATTVEAACAKHGIPFLGDIPLHPQISADADRGAPTVVSQPDSPQARAFIDMARDVSVKIGL